MEFIKVILKKYSGKALDFVLLSLNIVLLLLIIIVQTRSTDTEVKVSLLTISDIYESNFEEILGKSTQSKNEEIDNTLETLRSQKILFCYFFIFHST